MDILIGCWQHKFVPMMTIHEKKLLVWVITNIGTHVMLYSAADKFWNKLCCYKEREIKTIQKCGLILVLPLTRLWWSVIPSVADCHKFTHGDADLQARPSTRAQQWQPWVGAPGQQLHVRKVGHSYLLSALLKCSISFFLSLHLYSLPHIPILDNGCSCDIPVKTPNHRNSRKHLIVIPHHLLKVPLG